MIDRWILNSLKTFELEMNYHMRRCADDQSKPVPRNCEKRRRRKQKAVVNFSRQAHLSVVCIEAF
jgi:hypothetical protein